MPKLTEDEKEQLRAGLSMRDEDIDYSDIPPIREIPSDAIRGRNSRFYRGRTVYLTEELHAFTRLLLRHCHAKRRFFKRRG
jgi:hypothetical protein